MGGLCSCLEVQEPEETVALGGEDDPYSPFYSHTPSFVRLGPGTQSVQSAPYPSSNNVPNLELLLVSLVHGATESTNSKLQHALESQSSDEDVCPTCFEEYTDQNPKIIAKCNHHYHLGCIYEWKERSETCPICRQVMIFDEVGLEA